MPSSNVAEDALQQHRIALPGQAVLDPLEDRQQPRGALAAVEPQELREHVVDVDDL